MAMNTDRRRSRLHLLDFLIDGKGVSASTKDDVLMFLTLQACPCSSAFAADELKKIKYKWSQQGRWRDRVLQHHSSYFSSPIPECICKCEKMVVDDPPMEGASAGRPKIPFESLSSSAQLKRVAELRRADTLELTQVLHGKLWKRGFRKEAVDLKKLVFSGSRKDDEMTPAEGLSLLITARLTKRGYKVIRKKMSEKGRPNLWPSYEYVREEKQRCFPEGLYISETSMTVGVQDLLDHTTVRLLSLSNFTRNLTLVTKWGADGSTDHQEWGLKAQEGFVNSGSILLVSLVPIVLTNEKGRVVWKNPSPGSPEHCRPIAIHFAKETKDESLRIYENISQQIRNLEPTKISLEDGPEIEIRHCMHPTMFDQKFINTITHTTSNMRCYLCGILPSDYGRLSKEQIISMPVSENSLIFGLSTLHLYIRCAEFILHIGYRMPFKVWQLRSDAHKGIAKAEKKRIQDFLKRDLGIIVDQPRSGGSGTTTTGNVARKLFNNPASFASATGVSETLIQRLGQLLRTVNSMSAVPDIEQNQALCEQIFLEYLEKYSWYPMPPGVHKLVLHSTEVIQHFSTQGIPTIGMLTEEAAEAKNKDIRYYRKHHCRTTSWMDSNRDLFQTLLMLSDPVIRSHANAGFMEEVDEKRDSEEEDDDDGIK